MSNTSGKGPDATLDVLGTEWVATEDVIIDVGRGGRSKKRRIPVSFLDWTINGVALRSHPPKPSVAGERTLLVPGREGHPYPVESLRALLDGYQENDKAWVRFADGRTAILYCSQCADLNCATISARIEFGYTKVRWSSVAYQTGLSEGPDFEGFEPVTFTFARNAYESTIREQLRRWGG
ncbi:hypothetical protein G3T36_10175 [Diaminobutyricibacter tongyongensis]|uniref:Uncharacterized protein n=1 Tax=Leifsonia tongyongensis TaxID=1268043 RepID=A0A6L9XXT6_9MICO|nr:hypothetical protein [Diaminobutyricibacter tongyongensis]NEN06242.1 hypothetical protein [Diaminobutyricibacter tongyongensis]